jgi:ornithine carbamoyltransferase
VPKSLLRIADLGAGDVARLLDRAASYKANPQQGRQLLAGSSVVLYFAKPSTRTRVSFETAVHRLGGLPITVGPTDLQMGRGETIEDTARVLSRMARIFVARTFRDEDLERFDAAATIPVVNALTDGHHPCQAIADLLTLRERFGQLAGLTVAYVGAGNNVTHSLMEAAALSGVHVRVATPASLAPDPQVVARARALAAPRGTSVEVVADARLAVRGADAVYADTWLSMGDPEGEREARMAALMPFQVDAALMAEAKPGTVFLHCLPAHRGEEVTSEVADGPASLIFDQAENRLHTSVAILEAVARGELTGP